jgi:hypothetical protein
MDARGISISKQLIYSITIAATSKGFNSQHSLTHSHASINEIVVENMKHVVRTELLIEALSSYFLASGVRNILNEHEL